ncbi:staphylopine uptake ABC transporter permease subunit CntC [Cohnella sp.]|uniref:staphylopine uptake ABC transporter permease subunit CntC n=1 Tax=Cohnella sp. TaxID=1883426 RepID=UPI0037043C20
MKLFKQLMADRIGFTSLSFITVVLAVGACAPWAAPHDPNEVELKLKFAGASWTYWLGNDHLGRCVLSRLIYGIRPSVLWVLGALLVCVFLGAVLGFVAGYFRGKIDSAIMRVCDVMLSFPGYVMTLAIVGVLGTGLDNILIAFIAMKWAWFARVIRAAVLQYSDADYVRFAKTLGAGHLRIMAKHVVPVSLPEIAVIASSAFGSMMLQVSGLSFLGLGIQAPYAEWGMMLNEARSVMFVKPELMMAPGLAIMLIVAAVNFLTDSLQTALDPKLLTAGRGARSRRGSLPGLKLQGRETA